jgi:hypothetical protein
VDCGRALAAYMEAKTGNRQGRRVGFPRYKRKGRRHDSFRLRNKKAEGGSFSIRVGEGSPRSVILPGIGTLRVHDDTRRLRRLLRPVEQLDPMIGEPVVSPRARILFATVRRHGSRWSAAWSGCGAVPVPCRAQSEALATGPRPPGGSPASMPVSPTCEEASFTRSPPSSPRPTAGWPSKISLSQTSSVTATVHGPGPQRRREPRRLGRACPGPDRQAGGRVTNASGGEGAGRHRGVGKPPPTKEEPTLCARRS